MLSEEKLKKISKYYLISWIIVLIITIGLSYIENHYDLGFWSGLIMLFILICGGYLAFGLINFIFFSRIRALFNIMKKKEKIFLTFFVTWLANWSIIFLLSWIFNDSFNNEYALQAGYGAVGFLILYLCLDFNKYAEQKKWYKKKTSFLIIVPWAIFVCAGVLFIGISFYTLIKIDLFSSIEAIMYLL